VAALCLSASNRRVNDASPSEHRKRDSVLIGHFAVCVDLAIEVCNHVLKRGDRLLDGGNLSEFIVRDRPATILERDHEFSSVLFQLDKRQTMVRWVLHLGLSGVSHNLMENLLKRR
jgi:hypothetical protein